MGCEISSVQGYKTSLLSLDVLLLDPLLFLLLLLQALLRSRVQVITSPHHLASMAYSSTTSPTSWPSVSLSQPTSRLQTLSVAIPHSCPSQPPSSGYYSTLQRTNSTLQIYISPSESFNRTSLFLCFSFPSSWYAFPQSQVCFESAIQQAG